MSYSEFLVDTTLWIGSINYASVMYQRGDFDISFYILPLDLNS